METYTLRGIESMLGISRAVIGSLVASGFVTPTRGKRNEYRFTFQEVVLLRTAYGLRRANIPARKILRSLKRLRETLPEEMPLTGLRITAVGSEVAVQEGNSQRHVETGQLLFDFDVQAQAGTIAVLAHEPAGGRATLPKAVAAERAEDWFRHGSAVETDSKAEAEAAYRRAIELAPDYVDPVLNLGAMMCDSGRCAEAVALFGAALERAPDEALLHFNLAVALEDLGRREAALASYEDCLRLAPKFADAHYNAARLHELAGHPSQAIRHYSEYRRLQR
jgi:tetratricopeptide (TPR) repeat protein